MITNRTRSALFLILLLLGECPSYAEGSAVVKIGKTLFDVLKFSVTIWEAFKTIDESQSDPAWLMPLTQEIGTMIQSTERQILHTVTLQNKMSGVVNVRKHIKSLLIDLDNIVQANDSVTRRIYIDIFCSRFGDQRLVEDMRDLPELLEDNSFGTSAALIDVITDHYRCNMTALYDFKALFFNLEASWIALEKVFLNYTSPVTLSSRETQRYSDIVAINKTFSKKEAVCQGRFFELAREDVVAATDASKLLEDNNQRYPWVTSDVFYLYPYRTHQFLYMKYLKGSVIWDKSDLNKIVVFSVRDDVQYKNVSFSMQGAQSILKKYIGGKDDTSAAKNVGEAVTSLLDAQGFCLVKLVVFFDGGEYASRAIELDNDSPVVLEALDNIELEYCSKSKELCNTDPAKILGYFKTVQGEMKIAAYVKEMAMCSEFTREYIIGGAFRIHTSFVPYIIILVSVVDRYLIILSWFTSLK